MEKIIADNASDSADEIENEETAEFKHPLHGVNQRIVKGI